MTGIGRRTGKGQWVTVHLVHDFRGEDTACCGRLFAELPGQDRLTDDPTVVTCTPKPVALVCSRGPVSPADAEHVRAFGDWLRTRPPKPSHEGAHR